MALVQLRSTVSETEERDRGVAFQNNRQRGFLRNYDSQENVNLGLRKVVQKPMANEKVPAVDLHESSFVNIDLISVHNEPKSSSVGPIPRPLALVAFSF